MVVNDDAGNLTPRGALRSIASKLAPTGNRCGHPCIAVQCKNRIRPPLLVRAAPSLKKTPRPTPVTSERIPLCEQV
ncbi:hypothetical protein C1X61_25035 [Pseudomonas sp. FW215-T2]|nr:hypothetical protein C1X61_25035 [Pseudomonas sp. FW215-T2]PNA08417.1 hypothetical protein C1X62_25235 [Pseudomonas sp. FW215-R3]PNB34669.1 hypothetical protein C1X63_26225 [Pseudomonas sp. FW305-131]